MVKLNEHQYIRPLRVWGLDWDRFSLHLNFIKLDQECMHAFISCMVHLLFCKSIVCTLHWTDHVINPHSQVPHELALTQIKAIGMGPTVSLIACEAHEKKSYLH